MSPPPLIEKSNMVYGRSVDESKKVTVVGQVKTPTRSGSANNSNELPNAQRDSAQVPFRRRRVSPASNNIPPYDSISLVGSHTSDSTECITILDDDISIKAILEVDCNENSDKDSVQELHICCANARSVTDLDQILSMLTVETASTLDGKGRTALHILSENKKIVENVWGCHQQYYCSPSTTPIGTCSWAASFSSPSSMQRVNRGHYRRTDSNTSTTNSVPHSIEEPNVILLQYLASAIQNMWEIYPPAIITTDNRGYIPFEAVLQGWVQSNQNNDIADTAGYHSAIQSIVRSVQVPSSMIPSMQELKKSVASRWSSSAGIGYQNHHDTGGSQRSIPAGCNSPDIEASNLKSQSSNKWKEISQLNTEVSLTAHALSSILMLSTLLDLMDNTTADNRQQHSMPKRRSDSKTIRRRSIENLLKQHTHQDMKASIVQITASIPDFIKICLSIENECHRNQCFNTLLLRKVILSKHSIGSGRWLTDMLQSQVRSLSDLAINYLQIVSSPMVTNGNWNPTGDCAPRTEKQLTFDTTSQDDFYNEMSRINNFVPSLLSLDENQIEEAATTKVVEEVLDRIISRPFAVTVVFSDGLFLVLMIFGYRRAVNSLLLGNQSGTVLKYIYLANIGIFYFVIREIGKAISLCTITRRTQVYFTFWNLIEMLTTILALVSSVAIRGSYTPLRSLLAITTGFMWLRVLSYLKGINMQLATFVLAILQIGRDLLWFAVILLVVVLMFSQMFFTLLAPDECINSSTRQDSHDCSQSEYYLKVYAILLGDFGLFKRENFNSVFSIFLAVFFTFLTTTILLNVLIAVASDSYEKCLMRGNKLFGRARVLMIAELVAFQNLLSFHDFIEQGGSWWNRSFPCTKGRSRSSVIFFVLSLSVTTFWTIGEVFGSLLGPTYGNLSMSLGSVVVNVLLLCCVIFFLSAGSSDQKDQYYRNRYLDWYTRYFQSTMVRMLGSSSSKIHFSGMEIMWQGRLHYLRDEMVRISNDSTKKWEVEIESLKSFFDARESSMQKELAQTQNTLKEMHEGNRQLLEKISELIGKNATTTTSALKGDLTNP